ncbi:hypothetical protein T492DRAFT_1084650 [Pavlovales sp. CCMP2436]|nr:hypothetical protein T492DRAFT_1084650 [Pavlovales sp. CCMP2436]
MHGLVALFLLAHAAPSVVCGASVRAHIRPLVGLHLLFSSLSNQHDALEGLAVVQATGRIRQRGHALQSARRTTVARPLA